MKVQQLWALTSLSNSKFTSSLPRPPQSLPKKPAIVIKYPQKHQPKWLEQNRYKWLYEEGNRLLKRKIINLEHIKQFGAHLYDTILNDIQVLEHNHKLIELCNQQNNNVTQKATAYETIMKAAFEKGYLINTAEKMEHFVISDLSKLSNSAEDVCRYCLETQQKFVVEVTDQYTLSNSLQRQLREGSHEEFLIADQQYKKQYAGLTEILRNFQATVQNYYKEMMSQINSDNPAHGALQFVHNVNILLGRCLQFLAYSDCFFQRIVDYSLQRMSPLHRNLHKLYSTAIRPQQIKTTPQSHNQGLTIVHISKILKQLEGAKDKIEDHGTMKLIPEGRYYQILQECLVFRFIQSHISLGMLKEKLGTVLEELVSYIFRSKTVDEDNHLKKKIQQPLEWLEAQVNNRFTLVNIGTVQCFVNCLGQKIIESSLSLIKIRNQIAKMRSYISINSNHFVVSCQKASRDLMSIKSDYQNLSRLVKGQVNSTKKQSQLHEKLTNLSINALKTRDQFDELLWNRQRGQNKERQDLPDRNSPLHMITIVLNRKYGELKQLILSIQKLEMKIFQVKLAESFEEKIIVESYSPAKSEIPLQQTISFENNVSAETMYQLLEEGASFFEDELTAKYVLSGYDLALQQLIRPQQPEAILRLSSQIQGLEKRIERAIGNAFIAMTLTHISPNQSLARRSSSSSLGRHAVSRSYSALRENSQADQTILNIKIGQLDRSQQIMASEPSISVQASNNQVRKQLALMYTNLQLMKKIVSINYFMLEGENKALPIGVLVKDYLSFEYQDWAYRVSIYSQYESWLEERTKYIGNQMARMGRSIFSVVHKLCKQLISSFEIVSDILAEMRYIYNNCKKEQSKRKKRQMSIDVMSREDLEYVMMLAKFKRKLAEQNSQLSGFTSIPKSIRKRLQNQLFQRFSTSFDMFIRADQEELAMLGSLMSNTIGFCENHLEIFTLYQNTLFKYYKGEDLTLQVWQLSKQLCILEESNKSILSIETTLPKFTFLSIQQFDQLHSIYTDQFKLAKAITSTSKQDRASETFRLNDLEKYKIYKKVLYNMENSDKRHY